MDIYSQCTTIVTLVFLLSDLICTTWADTDFDDLDMGIDLDVINSLASMLLDPDGAEDTGQQGECLYTCRNGANPRQNPLYVATSNGCGAYGLKLDLSDLPNIEKCCEAHDICYGTCNQLMDECDNRFSWCLKEVCEEMESDMQLNEEETEGCMMVAQLMSSTVQSLGCGAYLDSQAEACMCLKKDIKKQGSKSKRKTEL